jgi:hypothetical protein
MKASPLTVPVVIARGDRPLGSGAFNVARRARLTPNEYERLELKHDGGIGKEKQ